MRMMGNPRIQTYSVMMIIPLLKNRELLERE
jgi:hypothetical protein